MLSRSAGQLDQCLFHEFPGNILTHQGLAHIFQHDPTVSARLDLLVQGHGLPPVKSITRIAVEDVEMGGKTIRKNDRLRWFITGANRDPEKFENPDTFDINRWPNSHVGFGSGIHHCLGATLARLEGQEAFKALADRYENLSLQTDEFEYQPSITFRSLKSLPVSMN